MFILSAARIEHALGMSTLILVVLGAWVQGHLQSNPVTLSSTASLQLVEQLCACLDTRCTLQLRKQATRRRKCTHERRGRVVTQLGELLDVGPVLGGQKIHSHRHVSVLPDYTNSLSISFCKALRKNLQKCLANFEIGRNPRKVSENKEVNMSVS